MGTGGACAHTRVSLGWRKRVPEEGARGLVPTALPELSKIMLEITRKGPHKGFICRIRLRLPSHSPWQGEEAEGPARHPLLPPEHSWHWTWPQKQTPGENSSTDCRHPGSLGTVVMATGGSSSWEVATMESGGFLICPQPPALTSSQPSFLICEMGDRSFQGCDKDPQGRYKDI